MLLLFMAGVLAATPQSAREWLELAQTYAKQQNMTAALDAARKAESLEPANPRILQGLANFYATAARDLPKAATLAARYAENAPEDTTAWSRLAEFCSQANLSDCATDAGRKAVKANPYDEAAHFRLAEAYLLKQDFPSAIAVLENARKTFDKSPQIELALGVAYYGQRNFAAAIDQFLKTIAFAPDVPQPYLFLSRILENAGDRLPEITQRFAQLEAAEPSNPVGYRLHAKALVAQLPASGYPAEAQAAYALVQKSLALKEDQAESHYLAGLLLDRQREWEQAARHFERSIALNPNEATAHFRLARVYERLGRKDDAERERALHKKLSEEAKSGAEAP